MSDLEPNDPVWKTLGHASKVEPSPFFARNVMREVRRLADAPSSLWERLRSMIAGPGAVFATGACAVAAVALVVVLQSGPEASDSVNTGLLSIEETAEGFDPASEMAAVEYLGQLMAVADPGQLDDAALADLFF